MIAWSSRLETGHASVDEDHKKLIAQLNALSAALREGAGREQVTTMIEFLTSYARQHFAREEVHMHKVGCPALAENSVAHAQFISKLSGWIAQLRASGSTTSLVLDIHREASAWITAHIVGVDCRLRGCRTK